ncbi:phosphatase PAP2 family protein [Aegicerativicinus sediminis]|uniref:phosphatase PAP2 family protein n=1 Tax=Aegicerativicinus sediminis TaxID=2893202 RepID=UPI001E54B093|nr:phosphatase PAP2 family protein [Aegicerativicinus sediminis]
MSLKVSLTKITLILILFLSLQNIVNAQQKSVSPYEWKWGRDGIWTGAALGASTYGLLLIINKDDLSEEKFNSLSIDDINGIDRWVAGNYSRSASSISDIPFALAFVAPMAMLFDDEINDHTGQYIGIYLESLATTAALYSVTAGLVNRSRPYVYSDKAPMDRRLSNNGQRSFFSGHTAVVATSTFYTAKVFSDFNPDAKGKFFVWAGAAALPAAVGFLRMQAGQHFLTDVITGYTIGAAVGLLVPELHKRKEPKLSFYPTSSRTILGDNYNAITINYRF